MTPENEKNYQKVVDYLREEKQFPPYYKESEMDNAVVLFYFCEKRFSVPIKIPILSIKLIFFMEGTSQNYYDYIDDQVIGRKRIAIPIQVSPDVESLFEMPDMPHLKIAKFVLSDNSKTLHNPEKYGFHREKRNVNAEVKYGNDKKSTRPGAICS